MASSVRFHYPANGSRPPVDLCWYDGGMRPPIPVELIEANKELPAEGMMFVGDQGKILAGFNIQNPQIISGKENGNSEIQLATNAARWNKPLQPFPCLSMPAKPENNMPEILRQAEYITEAINLYALALRTGKMLKYDPVNFKITNVC